MATYIEMKYKSYLPILKLTCTLFCIEQFIHIMLDNATQPNLDFQYEALPNHGG